MAVGPAHHQRPNLKVSADAPDKGWTVSRTLVWGPNPATVRQLKLTYQMRGNDSARSSPVLVENYP